MKKHLNIAIDGPSGSGKSTLAKAIAGHYGIAYLDTGAIYRTIGLFVQRLGIASDNDREIIASLDKIHISMKNENGAYAVFLDDERMGDEIRTPISSMYASAVSKIPEVRAFLLDLQRNIAHENDCVLDGRDIGTVILPDADVKIFLSASDTERASRRFNELKAKGIDTSLDSVISDMQKRDSDDSKRKIAPAIPADDAVHLDNSGLTREETLQKAIEIINAKIGKKTV